MTRLATLLASQQSRTDADNAKSVRQAMIISIIGAVVVIALYFWR